MHTEITSTIKISVVKKNVFEIRDMEQLSPIFKGKLGHWLAKFVMYLFAIDKVNRVFERSCDYTGVDFTERLLNDLGVHYRIGNPERLQQLPEGSFITVSNHPYGGLDGIMLIDLMGRIRPDYKFMVNKILSLIKTMEGNFISVNPHTNQPNEHIHSNINGIRETIMRIENGHPVGFFPSGAVSDFSLTDLHVRDREWQESILRLIKLSKVPIVPIRFFDKNSPLFYFLGLINWRIRLIRMPHEVFNKKGKQPLIGIGKPITVNEQNQFTESKSFGVFLRKAVYEMPLPTTVIPKTDLTFFQK